MANIKITDLTAATALGGTELFECVQSTASVKASATQIQNFVGQSLVLTNAVGSFNSITISSGVVPYNTITNQAYGFFYSSLDQTFASANVAYAVTVNNSAPFNSGVTVASSTQITMIAAGVYEIAASLQFANADSSDHDATVFFKKNGVDITASATRITVPKAADGGAIVLTVSGFDQFNANEYIQCYVVVEDTDVSLDSTAAAVGPPAIPSIPSVNITAKRIG